MEDEGKIKEKRKRPGQQLQRVAVVGGASERQPGSRDSGIGPGLEILRYFGLASRASALITDCRRAARTSSVEVAAATAGSRKRATPDTGQESYMTAFTSAKRVTSIAPRTRRCCATPPPISCPATIREPFAFIAPRKRTSQAANAGIEAVATLSCPPECPKPGKSTATGRRPAAAMPSSTGCQTRLQKVP
jgi:hypothetical protein